MLTLANRLEVPLERAAEQRRPFLHSLGQLNRAIAAQRLLRLLATPSQNIVAFLIGLR